MKLAIITDEGEVVIVMDDLQDYNLDKMMARVEVADQIQLALQALKENNV